MFLTREFADLSGEDQVLRAFAAWCATAAGAARLRRLWPRFVSRLSGEALLLNPTGLRGAAGKR